MGTALVTGGRGFVGGWLAKALLERGERVVSFDRRRTTEKPSAVGMLGIEDELVQVEGDLVDGAELAAILEREGVDTVYHLAAETIVSTVQASPVAGFESNVRGTWTLLQACLEHGVERVVVASSDKAYGAHDSLPYREDFALQATAPYEASKAATDIIARSYFHCYGLPVAVTRFANIYGGGDLNFSRLVPEAVSAAIDGRRPVLRSDGSPVRDFLYVEDAADAYLAISDRLDSRRRPRRGVQRRRRHAAPGRRRRRADRAAGRDRASSRTSAGPATPTARSTSSTSTRRSSSRLTGWTPVVRDRAGARADDRLVSRAPGVAARRRA